MTSVAEVLEVLRQVEWVKPRVGGVEYCPCCTGVRFTEWKRYDGHYDDCKLAALLDEAEGLDREGCWRDGKRVGQEEKQDELTYPIMICSVCKKLDGICECEGEPIRWRIFQPEYYQSVLRTCGRGVRECDGANEIEKIKLRSTALVAIADTAHVLRTQANMRRVVHSNADYIPAYLLGPLCDALDNLDALDKEKK